MVHGFHVGINHYRLSLCCQQNKGVYSSYNSIQKLEREIILGTALGLFGLFLADWTLFYNKVSNKLWLKGQDPYIIPVI